MAGWKTQAEIAAIRKQYPTGSRIELAYMNEQGMPPGLKGIVKSVDDAGQLHMIWENGRSLVLVPGATGSTGCRNRRRRDRQEWKQRWKKWSGKKGRGIEERVSVCYTGIIRQVFWCRSGVQYGLLHNRNSKACRK